MTIDVRGTPYEQGFEHGFCAKQKILHNIEIIRKTIIQSKNLLSYQHFLHANLEYLEKKQPELMQEFQGIADGARIPLDDILMINICLYAMADKLPKECSMMLARGNATLDGKTYLVKNRDLPEYYEHIILRRDYGESIGNTIEVHVAGTVTYAGNGMNDRGLMIATTGMWSRNRPIKVDHIEDTELALNPSEILKSCRTVEDVKEYVQKHERLFSINLIAADLTGAAAFEIMDDACSIIYDTNGILVRTNHFISEQLYKFSPTVQEYPSSHARYERANSFLLEKFGKIRFQEMLQIAADHQNGSNRICRHGANDRGMTVYSSISVLEDKQIWTSLGNPCEALILTEM